MKKNEPNYINCNVANTLQLIGENWIILILREAFFGTRRFDEFQTQLGIARNILTNRLKKLTDNGILNKVPIQPNGKRMEYRLTEKGKDLFATIIAITQWGDRWITPDGEKPLKIISRENGKEIAPLRVRSADNQELSINDVFVVPGPGATEETLRRLAELQKSMED